MYIFLLKGELPWHILKYTNLDELFNNSLEIKRNILMEDLCKDLPNKFYDYMKFVKNLNFETKPDYNYLRSLFKNILFKIDIFTWMDSKGLKMDNYKEKNSLSKIRNKNKK